MKIPKVGDIVVQKKDVGEQEMLSYVVVEAGDVCLCSPWIKIEFNEDGESTSFIEERTLPILLHIRSLAGICSLNTSLLGPLCGLVVSKASFSSNNDI